MEDYQLLNELGIRQTERNAFDDETDAPCFQISLISLLNTLAKHGFRLVSQSAVETYEGIPKKNKLFWTMLKS